MRTEYQVTHRDGQRTPLLCIHGVGSTMHSWDAVIEKLPEDRPIVTYDLRGHGNAEKPTGPYSIDDFVSDALKLMDELDIQQFDVVGFSLGGLIAQGLALSAPLRARRVVLVGTVAHRTEEEQDRVLQRFHELKTEGPVAVAERSVERWYTPEYLEMHPEAKEETIREMASLDPDAYIAAYRVLATTDFAGRLHELQMPVLAIAGDGDVGSPPHMAKYIAEVAADGRLVVIKGVKHNMLRVASELIAKEIVNHVSK